MHFFGIWTGKDWLRTTVGTLVHYPDRTVAEAHADALEAEGGRWFEVRAFKSEDPRPDVPSSGMVIVHLEDGPQDDRDWPVPVGSDWLAVHAWTSVGMGTVGTYHATDRVDARGQPVWKWRP